MFFSAYSTETTSSIWWRVSRLWWLLEKQDLEKAHKSHRFVHQILGFSWILLIHFLAGLHDRVYCRVMWREVCLQYLLEAGWAAEGKVIGVTQPRRVAATSVRKPFSSAYVWAWTPAAVSKRVHTGGQSCGRGERGVSRARGGIHHQVWWLLWPTRHSYKGRDGHFHP